MPTYDYECPEGHRFEVFQRISDEPGAECPECGAQAKRLISGGAGFLFKGEGFYITDYRSDEYKKKASSEPGASGDTAASSPASAGSEGGKKAPASSSGDGGSGGASSGGGSSGGGSSGGGSSGSGSGGSSGSGSSGSTS